MISNEEGAPQSAGTMLLALQIRMARAAMRLSVQELARASGVSDRTISRIEQANGVPPKVTAEILLKLQLYFESEGFTFIPETGDARGPGVCWGRYPSRRSGK
jgi:transcriptional regulator with XRE-family HTH domain